MATTRYPASASGASSGAKSSLLPVYPATISTVPRTASPPVSSADQRARPAREACGAARRGRRAAAGRRARSRGERCRRGHRAGPWSPVNLACGRCAPQQGISGRRAPRSGSRRTTTGPTAASRSRRPGTSSAAGPAELGAGRRVASHEGAVRRDQQCRSAPRGVLVQASAGRGQPERGNGPDGRAGVPSSAVSCPVGAHEGERAGDADLHAVGRTGHRQPGQHRCRPPPRRPAPRRPRAAWSGGRRRAGAARWRRSAGRPGSSARSR